MDDYRITLAKVEATLEGVQDALKELRDEVRSERRDVVARNEWLQRNMYVNSKFDDQGKDISEIKQDMAAKRAPWWTIVTAIGAGIALVWSIFGPVISSGMFPA